MTAKTVRMALAAALLGITGAVGCNASSRSNQHPSTMPVQRPTTLPAAGGSRALASPDLQAARYAADVPPIQPVKPPMPIAPPEQPPVPPVKPPVPDRPVPPDPNNGENKALRPENIERELKPDELKALREKVEHPVMHVVVLWLKNHGDKAGRKALLDAREQLKRIPGVLDISVGECMPSDRPVVDSTYDIALIVTFKDEAAMKAYATHPTHVKLVDEVLKPNVSKYVVYDFTAK